MTIEGSIEAIGVSGRHWIGEGELDAFDLFRETLKSAKSSIRIAVFSLILALAFSSFLHVFLKNLMLVPFMK